ncbi:hypothetical protein ACFX1Q_037435 [Malus domestica]
MAMGIAECTKRSVGVVAEEVVGIVGKVGSIEAIWVKGGVFVGLERGKTGLRVDVKRLGRCSGVESLK